MWITDLCSHKKKGPLLPWEFEPQIYVYQVCWHVPLV
jgi:hypothetical protein